MILTNVRVKNFLSINGECEFPADKHVTVLLGANDHGKSNLLKALRCLNVETPITAEDENWDAKGARLEFDFNLSDAELKLIQALLENRDTRRKAFEDEVATKAEAAAIEEAAATQAAAAPPAPSVAPTVEVPLPPMPVAASTSEAAAPPPIIAPTPDVQPQLQVPAIPAAAEATPPPSPAIAQTPDAPLLPPQASGTAPVSVASTSSSAISVAPPLPVAPLRAEATKVSPEPAANASSLVVPLTPDHQFLKDLVAKSTSKVTVSRTGVDAELSIEGVKLSQLPEDIASPIRAMIPRVELFEAFSGELQDSVTAPEIKLPASEFLQGIFFYAGLDPMDCDALFIQDDETDKTLETASATLDKELRQIWTQGQDLNLHFQLKHRRDKIELLADDPSVKIRKARMSKRSAGVTQFFRLSMVLHARRKKNPSNSYIYVFDEPGVFLHPKGQKDLLQVFEQLSNDTQIVYATHSLFMLNQNFPERHRLISKDNDGTKVDSKPYRANWKYAVDALGVRLTANILFSPNILLVEGDSDPIYIYDFLRVLNNAGEIDADANLLGIMSYGDLPNLRFLIQTFKSENNDRLVGVVFDGDSQGRQYQKDVAALMRKHDVRSIALESGYAIEDYCLNTSIFLRAVEDTLISSFEAMEKKVPTDLRTAIHESWTAFTQNRSKPTKEKRQTEGAVAKESNEEMVKTENAENAGGWFKMLSKQLLDNGSSKVALARNYAFLSRDAEVAVGDDIKKLAMTKNLLTQIATTLTLPSRRAKKEFRD
jgi:predicted ATP-dependent endonuclease of OLD family